MGPSREGRLTARSSLERRVGLDLEGRRSVMGFGRVRAQFRQVSVVEDVCTAWRALAMELGSEVPEGETGLRGGVSMEPIFEGCSVGLWFAEWDIIRGNPFSLCLSSLLGPGGLWLKAGVEGAFGLGLPLESESEVP